MKKVLLIDLVNFWGGGQIYIYNLINEYKKLGFEVICISSQTKFQEIANEFVYVPNGYLSFLKLKKIITNYIDKVDIVHFNGNRALYLSFFIKNKKHNFVGTKHTTFFRGKKKSIKSYIARLVFLFLYKKINKLICVSQAIFNELPKKIQSRSIVIYNGVDISSNRIIDKVESPLTICYVARLDENKGIKDVLQSVKILYERYGLKIKLKIAGDGELREFLENFIIKNSDLDIEYFGFVSNPKEIYESSHIGILLSQFEGMPLNILEAFSAGLPFISYNIPGVNEIIRSNYNGFLIEKDNVEKVVSVILELERNRDKIKSLSINANKDYNEKYSLSIMRDKTIAVYESLIK